METLIHADIFFFITAIFVVFLTIGFTIVAVYVIKILRDLKYISTKVKEESDLIAEDIATLRTEARQEGFKIKHAIGFFTSLLHKKSSRRKKD